MRNFCIYDNPDTQARETWLNGRMLEHTHAMLIADRLGQPGCAGVVPWESGRIWSGTLDAMKPSEWPAGTVLFNPYTGKRRDDIEIEIDPKGAAIVGPDAPLHAAVEPKREPWPFNIGDVIWYINHDGTVDHSMRELPGENSHITQFIKYGNYYRTRGEAIDAAAWRAKYGALIRLFSISSPKLYVQVGPDKVGFSGDFTINEADGRELIEALRKGNAVEK